METKKVIEQKDGCRIEIEFHEHRIRMTDLSPYDDFAGSICFGKSKATEVAKAICPKYQELENERDELVNRIKLYDQSFNNFMAESKKQIKELETKNAKLLEALKNAKKTLKSQVPEYVILEDLEIIDALIQQSETK